MRAWMPPRRATSVLACVLAATALVAGCGGGSDAGGSSSGDTAESRPAPPKSEFPSAEGKTLAEVVKAADAPAPLVVSPAAMVFYKGENRYPFGVFHADRRPVSDAEVALYIAEVPSTKAGSDVGGKGGKPSKGAIARARTEALDGPAMGPFPATIESIGTEPAFRAQTTTSDPDAASVVYVTELDFPRDGEWRIAALVNDGDELTATLLPSALVGEFSGVPQEGDKAPTINTPTASDVGGDLAEITTRVPPDTQNRVDYADVLGKEPIVLLFATPQFCQSRVCGPVVDVAEQVKETHGGEAEFIHMEIFKDNDPSKGVREQVRAFNLPSEPWLFVIDRDGRIETAVEGAFGPERLTEAVEGVTGE
jgi:hypothetical protein